MNDHEDRICPVCNRPIHLGTPAMGLAGSGQPTVVMHVKCGMERLDDLRKTSS
jgi:hypothetical protein